MLLELSHQQLLNEKVTVAEAIGDLDYIGIGEHPYDYDASFADAFSKTNAGKIKRAENGRLDAKGLTFSEWSKRGRLDVKRFPKLLKQNPAYTPANEISEQHVSNMVISIPLTYFVPECP